MGAREVMPERGSPFNSALEIGIRTLTILEAIHPASLDMQRLVEYDYLAVHSGDAGGPESLHASLPLRTGELLVRREIIEAGLLLMMSRNLVTKIPAREGIRYYATEGAGAFLCALSSPYIAKLKNRAKWVVEYFGNASDDELLGLTRSLFDQWTTQFQLTEKAKGVT